MTRSNTALLSLMGGLLVLTVGLALAAYHNFWFWRLWWFDNVLHFLSGAAAGLVFLYFYFVYARENHHRIAPTWPAVILAATSSIFALGFIWELFEFSIDQHWVTYISIRQLAALEFGFGDSIGDLVSDILGALVAARIFKSTFNPSTLNETHHG